MRHNPVALAFLLAGMVDGGCIEVPRIGGDGFTCPPNAQTCGGARDCYSECYCDTEDTRRCESDCGARGERVQDLDESVWSIASVELEDEVVQLVNEVRAQGVCCGSEGCFDAVPPLSRDADLRRAARAHAQDMADQGYFGHTSRDGRSPFDRIREGLFRGCAMGENIAAGQPSAESVMQSWLDSDGHCANILSESFEWIGVGYHPAPGTREAHVWVQNFGG